MPKIISFRKAITLIEMMIVVVIIGITATMGVLQFSAFRERSMDREVRVILKQISAAEEIYELKEGSYFASSDEGGATEEERNVEHIEDINDNLKLYLPTSGSRNWNYTAYGTGCVQAIRNGGARNWYMNIGDDDPDSGSCS